MMIRRLVPQDAESYLSLRLKALQNSPESFGSTYEEEKDYPVDKYKIRFQSEDSLTFGAFENGVLVGIITLVTEKRIKLRHRATIVALYVSPDMRGFGIGKALIMEAINMAKELQGVEQIYLTVVTTNKAAKELYSLLGFEIYATERRALKLDDVYFDEDLMVLFF
ncbi:GNAT family N-acetyltransferase [Sporosarcina aquimarina]|uniref:GNAT family N-acetyltransferase n=1 Tax=Sporosarcina aquimarina TaxID=114975 RepID=UPI00203FBED9|nr:GNAT family N-acetyltransferase [Sporosarcina aquimarina]MCM3759016.1 GNAT family N-acetyltransferase [Sporosarcina aquimarina]